MGDFCYLGHACVENFQKKIKKIFLIKILGTTSTWRFFVALKMIFEVALDWDSPTLKLYKSFKFLQPLFKIKYGIRENCDRSKSAWWISALEKLILFCLVSKMQTRNQQLFLVLEKTLDRPRRAEAKGDPSSYHHIQ